ncbi:hypothetical protein SODALDRAFT_40611 [Sodiomyces alkalinus F11]|uniref:Uncharacterized protein n=1 Tax=Sodiomyces alkalinus (strain CBS 110278 / VKM F-3762 / F11) TaxID=1314773 RepID=A0A3N2Q9Q8_SODAK|nr:hypothetical protein SODALDRAFT_40611 [Sodiomyces alkalinus F11]ROT43499.1 hypothetical protein SODALDRAFT_40611 [Sodiomyces alkalinus F11]
MAPRSFPLEPFTLSDNTDSNTSMILSPIISVDLPDLFGSINDLDEMKRLVQSGELWIARTGICRFYLTVLLEDSNDGPDIALSWLVEHIATFLENLKDFN